MDNLGKIDNNVEMSSFRRAKPKKLKLVNTKSNSITYSIKINVSTDRLFTKDDQPTKEFAFASSLTKVPRKQLRRDGPSQSKNSFKQHLRINRFNLIIHMCR